MPYWSVAQLEAHRDSVEGFKAREIKLLARNNKTVYAETAYIVRTRMGHHAPDGTKRKKEPKMLRKLIVAAVMGGCLTAAVPAFAFSDTFLDGMAGITVYNVCYPGSVKADTFRFMIRMADTVTDAEKASVKNKVEGLAKISDDWCPAMKASGFSSIVEKFNSLSRQ